MEKKDNSFQNLRVVIIFHIIKAETDHLIIKIKRIQFKK